MPDDCVEQYLVDVKVAVLEAALRNYKDLVDDGYARKFKIHERYVRTQIPDKIMAWTAEWDEQTQ